jgi:hypothetical protein
MKPCRIRGTEEKPQWSWHINSKKSPASLILYDDEMLAMSQLYTLG